MTPQELKNSILQLAIQGKLVEQRPEEGTAEELYHLLHILENKTLKPISDDEIPFDIPSSWKWVHHNELFEIVGGSQPPKSKFESEYKKGYVRLYQIRDYGENPVPVFVPCNLVSKFSEKGDILLARYGASVGKVFRAENGAYNVAMAKSIPLFKENLVTTDYIYYYYLAPLYQNLVKNNSRSAQAGFNKEDLNDLLFPLPPLAEQKRIVAKIEEMLPLVDRYAEAWNRLEALNKRFPDDLKKSLLQLAIQGKLVPQLPDEGTGEELYREIQAEKQRLIKEGKIKKEKPLPEITGEEKPFDIPESWKWVRLKTISNINGGFAFKSTDYSNEGVRVIRISDFNEHGFVNDKIVRYPCSDFLAQYILEENNILLCMTGGTVGKCLYVNRLNEQMVVNQRVATIKVESAFPKYVYYVILSFHIQKIIQHSKNSTNDNISMDTINSFPVPLPPLAEQKRIVAKLEEILPLCEKLK